MKNNLRLILQLTDIKEELERVGETDLKNKMEEVIKDFERCF